MTLVKLILIFILPSLALASSAGHHNPSIMDLIFPAINFCIVFGFIILKVKKPISEMFTKNSEDVEALYNLADEKYKKAQIKYDSYSKKLEQLDFEITRIHESSEEDIKSFSYLTKEETTETIKRMEKDAANRLDSDRNQIVLKLNKDLLEKVIDHAKSTILNNKDFQSKATSNLVSSLS
jgi:F-type H+-transporting ATPase subunit b